MWRQKATVVIAGGHAVRWGVGCGPTGNGCVSEATVAWGCIRGTQGMHT